jgi:hypothetical protein
MLRARVDANQPEVVKLYRRLGASVQHLHTVGRGCPDLLIGYCGANGLAEVKDPEKPPSKRRLTDDEGKWHRDWLGNVSIIETQDDVIEHLSHLRKAGRA